MMTPDDTNDGPFSTSAMPKSSSSSRPPLHLYHSFSSSDTPRTRNNGHLHLPHRPSPPPPPSRRGGGGRRIDRDGFLKVSLEQKIPRTTRRPDPTAPFVDDLSGHDDDVDEEEVGGSNNHKKDDSKRASSFLSSLLGGSSSVGNVTTSTGSSGNSRKRREKREIRPASSSSVQKCRSRGHGRNNKKASSLDEYLSRGDGGGGGGGHRSSRRHRGGSSVDDGGGGWSTGSVTIFDNVRVDVWRVAGSVLVSALLLSYASVSGKSMGQKLARAAEDAESLSMIQRARSQSGGFGTDWVLGDPAYRQVEPGINTPEDEIAAEEGNDDSLERLLPDGLTYGNKLSDEDLLAQAEDLYTRLTVKKEESKADNKEGEATMTNSKKKKAETPQEEKKRAKKLAERVGSVSGEKAAAATTTKAQLRGAGASKTKKAVSRGATADVIVVRPKAAYVLTVFSCYSDDDLNDDPPDDATFHDAALLLKVGVHQWSSRNPNSGSGFDYDMIAIVHQDAVKCRGGDGGGGGEKEGDTEGADRAEILRRLGYRVLIKGTPVDPDRASSEYLKSHLQEGDDVRDYVRLHAYKLVEYDAVVLVDFDTLLLQPPDDALGIIVANGVDPSSREATMNDPSRVVVRKGGDGGGGTGGDETPSSIPSTVDAAYTLDFTSVAPGRWSAGVNLSFLVMKPSVETFNRLLLEFHGAPFTDTGGWGEKGRGPFPGWMTSRGLLTYYFTEVAPDASLELHRCVFGNGAESPSIRVDDSSSACRDAREQQQPGEEGIAVECTDCRTSVRDVVVADLSVCRPPWTCHYPDGGAQKLCQQWHWTWFAMRQNLEDRHPKYEAGERSGTWHQEKFLGFCYGSDSYAPMKEAEKASQ